MAGILEMFLPMCLDRLDGRLDDDTIPVLHRFVELASLWLHREIATEGLVHADFRPDNFLFGRTDDAPPLAVVDWQTLTIGASVSDVAYLLGAAIDPARRREVEHDQLATYRDLLAGYGVEYDAETCWNEYALRRCTASSSGSRRRSWPPRPTREQPVRVDAQPARTTRHRCRRTRPSGGLA